MFKVLQFAILLSFVVCISDLRRKPGMVPLVSERVTRLVKLSYVFPIGIYGFVLGTLDRVLILDYMALGLTVLGTLLSVKAKLDLSRCHTWAGYCSKDVGLVSNGVYRHIRHPLYTGIFIFIIGAVATVIPHAPWFLTATLLLSLAYIMPFLAVVASRETAFLKRQFGKEFSAYRNQVHAFMPHPMAMFPGHALQVGIRS